MIMPRLRLLDRLFDKLAYLKIKENEKIEGFLSKNEALGLYKIASKLEGESITVEIGSWKGKSTYCIAKGLKQGKVLAIDPFDCSGDFASESLYHKQKGKQSLLEQFTTRMTELNVLNKIEVRQGYSQDFIHSIPKIDFLFIDADHSIEGCKQDFLGYSDAIRIGGYIAFHDYQPYRKDLGPTWVIDNLVLPSGRYSFQDIYDSLWVGQKIK